MSYPSFPLLRTKLLRPQLAPTLVPRPRLLDKLLDRPDATLMLLVASAGSGKTTLINQFLEQRAWSVAWLSLDESDDDLVVFLSYVTAAVQGVFPGGCSLTQKLLRTPQPPPVDYLAATLVNELSDIPQPFALVLDDYHCLRTPSIHQLVGQLLRHAPASLRLVINSRFDPPLPLSRLASQGKLVEIRAADLRFRPAEAQALLEQATGALLPQEGVAALVEEMEGWAVGLHSVALSLRVAGAGAIAVDHRGAGDHRRLAGILGDEVFAGQPADVRDFLMRTSLLSQLTAPLCQALYAGDNSATAVPPDSEAILQRLERDSLFIETLDEGRHWYRYHNLFRTFLARKLEQTFGKAEIAALHRRASLWYWEQNSVDAALRHAALAQDAALAADFVEAQLQGLLVKEDWPTLERWLNLVPGETIQQRPRLLVAQAWILYFHYRLAGLPALLEQAQAMLDDGGVDAEAGALVRRHIGALLTVLLFVAGDYPGALASAQVALADNEPGHPLSRGYALFFQSLALYATAGEEPAIALCARIVNDPLEATSVRARVLVSLCHIYGIACRPMDQERAAWALLKLAQEHGLDVSRAWAHRNLGRAFYERHELDKAVQHFALGVELRYLGHFVCTSDCYVGLALAYLAQGRLEEAQAAAAEMQAFYNERGMANLPEYDSFQARFSYLQGDTDQAMQTLARSQSTRTSWSMVAFETATLTRVMLHILEGSDAQRRAAFVTLDNLQRQAEDGHAVWHLICILTLRAIALQREGQAEQALAAMEQAVRLGYPRRAIAVIVELGLPAKRLLQRLAQRGVEPAYVRDLLAAFPSPEGTQFPAPVSTPLVEPLSAREMEVLALLSQRLANKEIAGRLVVSPLTVKRHVTNILQKLGVDSRWDAVERAREIGLVPPA
jgi:LuxR family maltose regulon positive regulatory protein